MTDSGLGFGKRRLISEIIKNSWGIDDPYSIKYTLNDILYIIQEIDDEEGKKHVEFSTGMNKGYNVFRMFVQHLLYRNIANYDSMVLMTSEKGCLTDDSLLMIPRDLTKYPDGVPLKELIDKGPLKVYSFNTDTKKLELKDSDGVEFAKYDDVYELELVSGQTIKATSDHPFMLMDGSFKELKDLIWLDKIKHKSGASFSKYRDGNSIWKYTDRLRMVMTSSDNKENIKKYKTIMKSNGKNTNMYRYGGIIKNIKYLGKQNVYDVVNVRDNHNFIANGFVVSNTGKSSASIVLAREWCKLLGIRFDPKRHMAYSNRDVMEKINTLGKFEPIVADESVRFASTMDWSKKESKELRKKIAEVRTKHMLFILNFPLKINKMEKTYLDSFVNYWCDLFGRGIGAIYVKDRNPVNDPWRMKDFKNVGAYTEFTKISDVEKRLKKHPNFWRVIKFPKPPTWLYDKYLEIREKNVYDDETVRDMVTTEDIHRALLLLALQDIMMNDTTLNMNRISLHIKNTYDIPITKNHIQALLLDSKQLINKLREEQVKMV
jgi:hypothetical protein